MIVITCKHVEHQNIGLLKTVLFISTEVKMDINSRIARIIFIMLVFIITPSKTAIGHREPVNEEHVNKPTKKHGNKLLVILVDGMRHDALEKGLKGLDMMKTNGVYSKNGLVPSFPSVSFTNYYSITTGE